MQGEPPMSLYEAPRRGGPVIPADEVAELAWLLEESAKYEGPEHSAVATAGDAQGGRDASLAAPQWAGPTAGAAPGDAPESIAAQQQRRPVKDVTMDAYADTVDGLMASERSIKLFLDDGHGGPSHGSSPPVAPASGILAQQAAAVATAGEGAAVTQEKAVGPGSYELMVRLAAPLATTHRCVTVLFADIVGFTSMCDCLEPLQVMAFLNSLFTRFDSLCDVYGVYKVETIGDCFMVVGGLIAFDDDGFKAVRQDGSEDALHAVKVMSFAKAMRREIGGMSMPHDGQPLKLRVGLHSGPVTAGIVGSKMPRFCLFGDTVNTASRMESTCEPGAIHASAATAALLPDEAWAPTGGVQVKGKGEMQTFLWRPQPNVCRSQFAESSPLTLCMGPSPPMGALWGSASRGVAMSDGDVVRQQMELARRTMAAEAVGRAAGVGAG
ncbi:hypothetical protein GPECTOR_9g473 [Gonium pectorale]|uniref:Guanylate cyclase domain-containing protein n=1 Tax=Gonium pectorale TaxID=33097 RepID=A0A150GRG7_GONPE|nr:hypothetical protein GPECTOR_9g473 [Gonium pectorale]|eukprot:KXZ52429.1 hypothetical protein GPECTOR_9g473 [Gonium pectorale]